MSGILFIHLRIQLPKCIFMAEIIRISETAKIALKSVALLAVSGKGMNVGKISHLLHTSRNHTASVLSELVKKGILHSTRGPEGGFELNIQPEELSLYEIFEIFEGTPALHYCKGESCMWNRGTCVFGSLPDRLSKTMVSYLKDQKFSNIKLNTSLI